METHDVEYKESFSNKTAYLELLNLVEKGVFTVKGTGKRTSHKVTKRQ